MSRSKLCLRLAFANFLPLYSLASCFPNSVFRLISLSPQTPRRNIFFIRLAPESLSMRLQSLHVGKRLAILVDPPLLWATICPACHRPYSPDLASFLILFPHMRHLPGTRYQDSSRKDLEILGLFITIVLLVHLNGLG